MKGRGTRSLSGCIGQIRANLGHFGVNSGWTAWSFEPCRKQAISIQYKLFKLCHRAHHSRVGDRDSRTRIQPQGHITQGWVTKTTRLRFSRTGTSLTGGLQRQHDSDSAAGAQHSRAGYRVLNGAISYVGPKGTVTQGRVTAGITQIEPLRFNQSQTFRLLGAPLSVGDLAHLCGVEAAN